MALGCDPTEGEISLVMNTILGTELCIYFYIFVFSLLLAFLRMLSL